jgi:hypothetical protein
MAWLIPLIGGAAAWLAKDYIAEKIEEYVLPTAVELLTDQFSDDDVDDEEE